MTIKKLSKKKIENKEASNHDEKFIEQFIGGGGKTTIESKNIIEVPEEDILRSTLRMSKKLMNRLDTNRKNKIGNVSRNTWILEAIEKKLEDEA